MINSCSCVHKLCSYTVMTRAVSQIIFLSFLLVKNREHLKINNNRIIIYLNILTRNIIHLITLKNIFHVIFITWKHAQNYFDLNLLVYKKLHKFKVLGKNVVSLLATLNQGKLLD